MYKILFPFTQKQLEHICGSDKFGGKMKKLNGITKITRNSLEGYIETNYPNNSEIKCGFCGSIRKFNSLDLLAIDGELYLKVIREESCILTCQRSDNESTKNCESKQLNPNSKRYVMVAYGFNAEEEANIHILNRNKSPFYANNHKTEEDYKKYQIRDEAFYGKERYEEIIETFRWRSSKEGMIATHGLEKAEEMCLKRDSTSKNLFKQRYGDNWEEELAKRTASTIQTLENFIKRHGDIEGTKKYQEYIQKVKDNMRNINNAMSSDERSLRHDSMSKEAHKRKYGDEWEEIYKNRLIGVQVKSSEASKESMQFFTLLIDAISYLNVTYYIGRKPLKEWFIYDTNTKKIKLYDFCIKSLNIIVEYNGSIWHYNPNYNYSKDLPYGMDMESNKKKDEYKRNLAISNGFDYYEVYDTDDLEAKAKEIADIIINKYHKGSEHE